LYDRALAIYDRLVEREGRREVSNDLAMAFINKATAVSALGDKGAAVGVYDRALAIYERLVDRVRAARGVQRLATAYVNKATGVSALGTRPPPWHWTTGPWRSTSRL
jgi:lipopolysaccharide biosynthesis regulator YciM